jgi:hypothetical protein
MSRRPWPWIIQAWHRLHRPIFDPESSTTEEENYYPGPRKTYKYLRLAMLTAVAALAYSIIDESRHTGIHCFLGSISGYYYTPVRPVFIGVMLTIGVALIVMKGSTPFVDACLSLAGMMAPVVAFIPTSDDLQGVCRPAMLAAGHYEPAPSTPFIGNAIHNNLYTLAFAGSVALLLGVVAHVREWPGRVHANDPGTGRSNATTLGFWINIIVGAVTVIGAWILLQWGYGWVLDGHARAAVAMFVLLAAAAIANGCSWFGRSMTYGVIYIVVGAVMMLFGIIFVIVHPQHRSGHLVLWLEATEIFLFVVFWSVQTFQQSSRTRSKRARRSPSSGTVSLPA